MSKGEEMGEGEEEGAERSKGHTLQRLTWASSLLIAHCGVFQICF